MLASIRMTAAVRTTHTAATEYLPELPVLHIMLMRKTRMEYLRLKVTPSDWTELKHNNIAGYIERNIFWK